MPKKIFKIMQESFKIQDKQQMTCLLYTSDAADE